MSEVIETPAVVETAVVETTEAPVVVEAAPKAKAEKRVLPTITKVVPLEATESKVLIIDAEDEEGAVYAQLNLLISELSSSISIQGNKMEVVTIPLVDKDSNSLTANCAAVSKYALGGEEIPTDVTKVLLLIDLQDFGKTRRSVANTTGSKAKNKTNKTLFFERSLDGMILENAGDEKEYQYIYGIADTEYTKEANTKIARLVKNLVSDKKLYNDGDKRGFHKIQTRIPAATNGARTNDNYSFYFIWSEIIEKMNEAAAASEAEKAEKGADADVAMYTDGATTVANIVTIINSVYPDLVIDVNKPLFIECLKSEFEVLPSKLTFDFEANEAVDLKELAAAEKEEARLAKAAEKAEQKAAEKAAKAEAAKSEKGETVAPLEEVTDTVAELGEVAPLGSIGEVAPLEDVTPVIVEPVAPVAPVSPVAPVEVK